MLKQAREDVIRLDQSCKAGEAPRLLKLESKKELIKKATALSLLQVGGLHGKFKDITEHAQGLPQHAPEPRLACRPVRAFHLERHFGAG